MSEEELYAGLSVASELVQRGLLSKNRRAIIKELVLRWDGQVMEAIRKYGAGEELGQELGAAAEREIKSIITRVFSEMQTNQVSMVVDKNLCRFRVLPWLYKIYILIPKNESSVSV